LARVRLARFRTRREVSQWFPVRERGRAHGIIFMGTRLGGALAPNRVALIAKVGWRASFWIFGVFECSGLRMVEMVSR
jgi:MFS family permease